MNPELRERVKLALVGLIEKHADCLVVTHPDEMDTHRKLMSDFAEFVSERIGEPVMVFHPFGGDEVPSIHVFTDAVVDQEFNIPGVGEDPFGITGAMSLGRLCGASVAELYAYADGGPPPYMWAISKEDFESLGGDVLDALFAVPFIQVD